MVVEIPENLQNNQDSWQADALVERNTRMLQLPAASTRNRSSLVNWVEGTGSICRQEASFLFEKDLCAPQGSVDSGLTVVESLVERVCVQFYQYIQKVSKRV